MLRYKKGDVHPEETRFPGGELNHLQLMIRSVVEAGRTVIFVVMPWTIVTDDPYHPFGSVVMSLIGDNLPAATVIIPIMMRVTVPVSTVMVPEHRSGKGAVS